MQTTFFSRSQFWNKHNFSLIVILVLAFLTTDLVINQVSDVLKPQNVSLGGITLFIIIALVYSIGQYKILKYIDSTNKSIREKSRIISVVHHVVKVEQFFMIAIIAFIIFEVLALSQYHTVSITISESASFGLSAVLLFVFSAKFFQWYKSSRNSKAVLLFGLSFAAAGFLISGILLVELLRLSEQEQIRTANSEVFFPDTAEERGYFYESLALIVSFVRLSSFVLLLAATILLIHSHAAKMGKIKFWVIILLPLFYYLSTTIDVLGIYVPETDNEILIYYSLAAVNLVGGGILFAIPFRQMAKKMREDDPTRRYMMTAAYGFIFFFGLNQVAMFVAPYPPYGLIAQSISALATYMIFVGIYSTAVSMSQNMQLRQSIKRIALEDVNLLSSIGSAQMDMEVRRVVKSMKGTIDNEEKSMAEKTGIETPIPQDDMENYMKTVMEEVARARKPKQA